MVTPPAGPPPPGSISLVESIAISDSPTLPDLVDPETISLTDGVTLSATVPNVIGDSNGAADSILATVGLTVGTVTFVTSTTVPAGTVISQSPGSSSTETAGEAINLVISSGLPQVVVPNVVGDTLAQVAAAFGPFGLSETTTLAFSNTIPIGTVLSQSPVAGSSVTYGTSVALVLSNGPAPASLMVPETITLTDGLAGFPVPVPNVLNELQATATANLQSAGFNVSVTTQASSTVASGVVISQSPAAPSSAVLGSSVNLVVSSGPAHVTIALNRPR